MLVFIENKLFSLIIIAINILENYISGDKPFPKVKKNNCTQKIEIAFQTNNDSRNMALMQRGDL